MNAKNRDLMTMVFEKDFMETIKYPNMVFEKVANQIPEDCFEKFRKQFVDTNKNIQSESQTENIHMSFSHCPRACPANYVLDCVTRP